MTSNFIPQKSRHWGTIGANIATGLICLLWVIPIVWAIVVSFRPPQDSLGHNDVWFSDRLTLESYQTAIDLAPFFPTIEDGKISDSYYANTIQYVVLTLAVQLMTMPLAAFAFAHYEFFGKRVLFYLVLTQLMIPTVILLVPNFRTIRVLGLYDTTLAIAMPYFGSAFGTFLLRQAFLEVPRDMVDSGLMDGCRWYHLLRYVYLPPSRATLVAFGLVSVSFHWNSLLWPLVVTSDKSRPLTMGLLRFTQLTDIGARWSLVTAATIIIIFPLMLIFLIFQKQFIRSFMHSGLK
ncbi:MAG: carbohydrate ABC transporter permease [Anaerolineae bacterium]|nr:carbohydrate ABC transporter permease [Anaerolineae bacterium]MDQ7036807.1 carbohydrate ABC transporter permease [Anaerolineae bacterium]